MADAELRAELAVADARDGQRETLELTGTVGTRNVSTMDTSELLQELQAHHTATGQFLTEHATQRGAHTQND